MDTNHQEDSAMIRAHERIDGLERVVAGLAPMVDSATRNADRALAMLQENGSQIREHVAECRIVRDSEKETRDEIKSGIRETNKALERAVAAIDSKMITASKEGNEWAKWATQGTIGALLLVIFEVGKHFFWPNG